MGASFEASEIFLLHNLVARLDRIAEETILPAFGLTYAEFEFLLAVELRDGEPQGTIAGALLLGKSAVSQRVSQLCQRGLVTQQPCDDNKREKMVRLTPEGRRLLVEAQEALVAHAEPYFLQLEERRAGLGEALRILRTIFQGVS